MSHKTVSDSELAAALEMWLKEAMGTIHARFNDLVQLLGSPKWHADQEGGFKRYPHTAIYNHQALEEAIFTDSKAWSELEKIADKHTRLKQHSREFLRTGDGIGRQYGLRDLFIPLLPHSYMEDTHKVCADIMFDFGDRIENFLKDLNADYVERIIVWPIRELATDTPIKLDDHTEFRELTAEEKVHCLNFEFIRPDARNNIISSEHSRWFGLCHRKHDKKSFGHEDTQWMADFTRRFADLEQILEDFLVAVPLVTGRAANHAGGFYGPPHFELGRFLVTGIIGHRGGAANDLQFIYVDECSTLHAEAAAALRETWTFIRSGEGGSFRKRVRNAARRFYYAETRSKTEDALVDLMVAAESLYLNENKNEIKFRMSINSALWADGDHIKRQEIFENFKEAYNLRSKIVHGSDVEREKVSRSISLISPLIKAGIKKAISHLKGNSDAPDWKSMKSSAESAGCAFWKSGA